MQTVHSLGNCELVLIMRFPGKIYGEDFGKGGWPDKLTPVRLPPIADTMYLFPGVKRPLVGERVRLRSH